MTHISDGLLSPEELAGDGVLLLPALQVGGVGEGVNYGVEEVALPPDVFPLRCSQSRVLP